nr:RecName: Full=Uncharacterized protein SMPP7 [Nautilus macromphalus]
LYSLLTEK